MKCDYCGEDFEPRTVTQRFCCKKCSYAWHGRRKTAKLPPERRSITFTCANPRCGRTVVTETTRRDMRTRFCCAGCEKAYWRHPPKDSAVFHVVKTIRDIAAEKVH